MIDKNILEQYFLADANLIPLQGIVPFLGWAENDYEKEEILDHAKRGGNIGWKLSNKELVIDIDPRNDGEKSFAELSKLLNLKLSKTVKTPSGGYHIYLKIPEKFQNLSLKKNLKNYPGVDFLSQGAYCLITGCEKKNGKYFWSDEDFEFNQVNAPTQLINFISKEITKDNLGDFEGLVGGSSANWPKEKVEEMLTRLDPSMGNNDWVRVGMALHDWDPINGLELWENWSKNGDNYEIGETEKRWKSFDIGGGVTLGTISHMVKEVNFDENAEKVLKFIEKIKISDEKNLEFDIFPILRKSHFSKIDLEKLAKAVQDRFKELSGVKIPIANVRQTISNTTVVNGDFIEEGEIPEWCKKWIYVNSHNCYVELETLKVYKSEAFNLMNGKFVPENLSGSKHSATKYIADGGFVETVDVINYLPMIRDKICKIDNMKVLNSFNPDSIPVEANEFTEEGLAAIEMVKKHIKFICTTDENAKIFTEWLAHNIQYPGKQILWSPVIQSIQGVGKSFFGELLRMCLGDRNVGTVSPTQVVSDFNGWATNVIVNVLEELRVKGHNRHDAVNALKPLITDRMIQINEKGIKQFMTYNTANYICFTNYKDAIPLDEDDRRWWVIFVPVSSLKQMEEIIGEPINVYFPKLFDSVRQFGHEVRKWFLEMKLSKEFLLLKQAPMTEHKKTMIANEEASFDGLLELKEFIEKGGNYFNSEVICSGDLFESFMFEHPEIDIVGRSRNIILKKLGYSMTPRLVKIDGKPRRIWTKVSMENETIREKLKLDDL